MCVVLEASEVVWLTCLARSLHFTQRRMQRLVCVPCAVFVVWVVVNVSEVGWLEYLVDIVPLSVCSLVRTAVCVHSVFVVMDSVAHCSVWFCIRGGLVPSHAGGGESGAGSR